MSYLEAAPAINALLNSTTTVLLVIARVLIGKRRIEAHRNVMLAAIATSAVFLTNYLYYHAHVGSVHFQGHGFVRPVYFAILLTHTVLAAVIVPLILVTLYRGLKRQDIRHRAIARWTFPLWLYVSVTGVVIYVMLYRISY